MVSGITTRGLTNWLWAGAHVTCLKTQGLFFTTARNKWAQEMCRPRSSNWQLNRTDWWRKQSYPLPIWQQITQRRQHAGWLAICPIIHKASCYTAHFELPSHAAPGRFLHMAITRVLGRKGVSILKNRNFLVSGYGAWVLRTKFYHRSVILSVKRGRGDKCWTLPSTLSERRYLRLIYSGLGNSILTGLATILPCYFIHWHNQVLELRRHLYRSLTICTWQTILSVSIY